MRLLSIMFLMFLAAAAQAAPPVDAAIDDCGYTNSVAAEAAWAPMSGSAKADVAVLDGQQVLRLPCNFSGTTFQRAAWDRKVQLDLASCRGICFKIFCRNVAAVSQFSIYFQSGEGWYTASFFPESTNGWNTITIDKAAAHPEGKPAGWGQVRTIRVSAWRGRDENAAVYLRDIRKTGVLGLDAGVAILRNESAGRTHPEELASVNQYAESTARMLQAAGINSAILSDLDVTGERLKKARLVVLPHNPVMPDDVSDALTGYLKTGGKLLVFYGLPDRLRAMVGIDGGAHIRSDVPGFFSSIRFDGTVPGAPTLVRQQSWNISEAKPVAGTSCTVAEWFDSKGKPTGHAAVVASSNCVLMTHVLLNDDPVNKQRMLLAMAGRLVPDFWRETARGRISKAGGLAGCPEFDSAAALVADVARLDQRAKEMLAGARALHTSAKNEYETGRYVEACDKAAEAGQRLRRAFCMAQQPLAGEFRAFWCHSAFGVDGMEWDEAVKRLADNGFTAILPNLLWGGVAFYDSAVLPVDPEVTVKGDQVAKCLAACRKYGLQIHVWKVNWNLGSRVPAEFVARLRRENRLQASSRGEEELWLCPSHPANRKLEIDAMIEVVRKYDVDGLHFDYIRYPDNDHCFCNGCRERFAGDAGVAIRAWPKDVLSGGTFRLPWLEWRRGNITAMVKAVSEQARAIRPKIKLSAAVFRNWAIDRDLVGQDWKLWCEKGYLDFVCPMDYTESDRQFDDWIEQQKRWCGATPCYPGIGASASAAMQGVDRVIGQILVARRRDTKGFVIFNYGAIESHDLLPMLGLGITEKR